MRKSYIYMVVKGILKGDRSNTSQTNLFYFEEGHENFLNTNIIINKTYSKIEKVYYFKSKNKAMECFHGRR